jgi:hypothetical protein
MAASGPSLSVIVPATDRPPTLPLCVAAIEPQLDPADELVVVDRASGRGPAAARNEGAARAAGELLVFIDADVVVASDALARLRAAFPAAEPLAALFGSYDDRPAARGVVSRFRNLLNHHVHQGSAGEATTFWAGLGAIRADAFATAGGFDADRYPRPSIEDIELGSRIAAAGGRIVLDPELRGTHLKRWTLASMVGTDLLARGAPWVELLVAGGDRGTLNLGWRHRLSAAASLLMPCALLARRPSVAVACLVALLALNARFYALLARRIGPRGALAGPPLHALHHLTALAAVPLGLWRHLRARPPTLGG